MTVTSPVLLPELSSLTNISIEDKRYWKTTLSRDNSWNTRKTILELGGNFFVKKCGLDDRRGINWSWSLSEEELAVLEQNGFNRNCWEHLMFQDPNNRRDALQLTRELRMGERGGGARASTKSFVFSHKSGSVFISRLFLGGLCLHVFIVVGVF